MVFVFTLAPPRVPNPDKFTDIHTGFTHFNMEITDFNRDGYLDIFVTSAVTKLTDDPTQSSMIYYGSASGYSKESIDRLKNFGYSSIIGDDK